MDQFINGSSLFWLLFMFALPKSQIKCHSIRLTVRCQSERRTSAREGENLEPLHFELLSKCSVKVTNIVNTSDLLSFCGTFSAFTHNSFLCDHMHRMTCSRRDGTRKKEHTFNGQFINLCMRKNRKISFGRRKRKSLHLDTSTIGLHHNCDDDRNTVYTFFPFSSPFFRIFFLFSGPFLL